MAPGRRGVRRGRRGPSRTNTHDLSTSRSRGNSPWQRTVGRVGGPVRCPSRSRARSPWRCSLGGRPAHNGVRPTTSRARWRQLHHHSRGGLSASCRRSLGRGHTPGRSERRHGLGASANPRAPRARAGGRARDGRPGTWPRSPRARWEGLPSPNGLVVRTRGCIAGRWRDNSRSSCSFLAGGHIVRRQRCLHGDIGQRQGRATGPWRMRMEGCRRHPSRWATPSLAPPAPSCSTRRPMAPGVVARWGGPMDVPSSRAGHPRQEAPAPAHTPRRPPIPRTVSPRQSIPRPERQGVRSEGRGVGSIVPVPRSSERSRTWLRTAVYRRGRSATPVSATRATTTSNACWRSLRPTT